MHTVRRGVVCVSLLLAGPLFMLFTLSSGRAGYIVIGLAGAFLLASFSVTVVMSQAILSRSEALASGIMLGFGTGIGGLGVGIFGHFAEVSGITAIIHILSLLPLAAGIMALTLKDSG